MKKMTSAVLTSLLLAVAVLSGCGPTTDEEMGAQPAVRDEVSQQLCLSTRCLDDSECTPCTGYTVSCLNRACRYTSTGGGGGGGSAHCQGVRCASDAECVPYCTGTSSPSCINHTCVP
ncbi:hypothetical protein [Hyalangium versicolor]|uniref:hypothetical protein n=1 Tax=Hyalangium versicolor TaxID=2861190 RepID=UPI001CCE3CA5|nr:hypothetical protein [Hyalangium versicolor]